MDFLDITFVNWTKYQPRKDIKNPHWFALSNMITEDEHIYDLTSDEFKAFIHFLCLASRKNDATTSINLEKAERTIRVKKDVMLKCADKLVQFGICTQSVRTRTRSVRGLDIQQNASARDTTLQDKTRHNTTEQDTAPPESELVDSDFERVYAEYPQRPGSGKGEGIKALMKQIHDHPTMAHCLEAAENYRRYCEQERLDPKYIKQFKTWCGSKENPRWREWIDWSPSAPRQAPQRYGRPEPKPIRYPPIEEIYVPQRDPVSDEEHAEKMAKVKELLNKAKNLSSE